MTTKQTVCCLVFNGYADWEPALALAMLRERGPYEVRTVGFSTDLVRSAGGMGIQPDLLLSELQPRELRMLIVPGGDSWIRGEYPVAAFERKLQELSRAGVAIAAICAATLACARAGLFAERAHTSNHRGWINKLAPKYPGSELYREQLSVRDRGMITAPGTASTEFACEILAELEIMDPARRATWFYLFKMGTLPPDVDRDAFFKQG
jgi:putative intracellular protease/amidase